MCFDGVCLATSVLITGETGVGKEVLGRHIHSQSLRSNGPFVAVNCAALPETLLESKLFGHKAGSFTAAAKDQRGLFEEANKGTIFLDEIGDTTPALQLKLLRVLQEQQVLRVGETRPRNVDVRIIAATNQDLKQAIADDRFREDLNYRLQVVHIEIPPLRERSQDILPVARHCVKRCSQRLGMPGLRLDANCLDFLLRYRWPGNIRELALWITACAAGMTRRSFFAQTLLCRLGVNVDLDRKTHSGRANHCKFPPCLPFSPRLSLPLLLAGQRVLRLSLLCLLLALRLLFFIVETGGVTMKVRLTVRQTGSEREVVLTKFPAVIGRSNSAVVRLDDRRVSRRHCEIYEIGGHRGAKLASPGNSGRAPQTRCGIAKPTQPI